MTKNERIRAGPFILDDVTPQMLLARVTHAMREIQQALAVAPSNPKTRELRARASTYDRAVMHLAGRVPSHDQAAALLEGVLELHARVFGELAPRPINASTPAMRAAMSNPRLPAMSPPMGRPSQRPTAPPPATSSRPPAAAIRSVPPVTLPPPSGRR